MCGCAGCVRVWSAQGVCVVLHILHSYCMCVCVCVCTYACGGWAARLFPLRMSTHACTRTHTRTHTHTDTRAHAHAHAHTYIRVLQELQCLFPPPLVKAGNVCLSIALWVVDVCVCVCVLSEYLHVLQGERERDVWSSIGLRDHFHGL